MADKQVIILTSKATPPGGAVDQGSLVITCVCWVPVTAGCEPFYAKPPEWQSRYKFAQTKYPTEFGKLQSGTYEERYVELVLPYKTLAAAKPDVQQAYLDAKADVINDCKQYTNYGLTYAQGDGWVQTL